MEIEIVELYYRSYHILSWYIHSGATGYIGLNEEQIERSFGYCHSIAQHVFLLAVDNICKKMRIDKAINSFSSIIEDLKRYPGKVIVEEQIKLLESSKNSQER
ncbi:MAG: hypothetical protein JW881_04630 [Spirochaetales bacterium]|nr:hypothetical protein [Spirochaetales bacterium]